MIAFPKDVKFMIGEEPYPGGKAYMPIAILPDDRKYVFRRLTFNHHYEVEPHLRDLRGFQQRGWQILLTGWTSIHERWEDRF